MRSKVERMAKLWDKGEDVAQELEAYLASDIAVDQKLVKYECIASKAHAKMLEKLGIIDKKELGRIITTLNEIIELDRAGKFVITIHDEDVHTKVENYLVEKLGDTGKKIHTYRSRNEQVLTNMRLYTLAELKKIKQKTRELAFELIMFAKKHERVPMPGYTHMQKAMLSSVGLWAGAFAESLLDDVKLLENALELADQSPLGSGASYGIPEKIDRELTAKEMGFERIQNNVLYCQNSRGKIDSISINALSQIMITLSKMAQDIILFTTSEFGYFSLSSEVSTGSSIMPQKRNPDVSELVKGNASVMLSYEFLVKNAITGVPSGYMKETQVVKEATIKAFELALGSLRAMKVQINGLVVNKERCISACTPELFATDEAYDLVKKEGIPFRDAYKRVGKNLDSLKKRDPVNELEKRLKNGSFYVKEFD